MYVLLKTILQVSTRSQRLLPFKVAGHRVLNWSRDAAARALRCLPGSWTLLGLPNRSIPSLRRWVEACRNDSRDRWRVTRGPHYESLLEPTTVRRPAPKTIDSAAIPHELTIEQHTVYAELFLAVIPGARVLGPNGTVITPNGQIVAETTWPRRYLPRERAWTALSFPHCPTRLGRYYTIATAQGTGYYHWLTEVLPRLFALETVPADDIRILVNSPLNPWQRESLELLGYGEQRCIPIGDQYFRAEILYLPSFVGDPSPHPFACRWLRERLLPASDPPRRQRRLYVTRRLARCRRVTNEQELEPILLDHGFEIIEAESLSFAEQIRLFSQAEVVAGPHGAGLTNILFAPESCKVLELFQPSYVLASSYKIATCLGQQYWFVLGQAVESETSDTANTMDISVEPYKFASCLHEIIIKPRCAERPEPSAQRPGIRASVRQVCGMGGVTSDVHP